MTNNFKIAGKELIKGNIGNALIATKSALSELIVPSLWRNGNFFFGINGADNAFIWGDFNSSLIAYTMCPVVASVIHKKTKCRVNGIQKILDAEDKEADNDIAKKYKQLLNNPNSLQTAIEFNSQRNIYKQLYGYCPMIIIKPVGFENAIDKWTLWNLPPWMLQMQNTIGKQFYEQGYKPFNDIVLSYMGYTSHLNPDTVYFIKENQISTGTYKYNSTAPNVSLFLPDSRLHALEKNINSLISSLDARGALNVNRGPVWFISSAAKDMDTGNMPADIEKLHEDFKKYGILSEQRKAIITTASMTVQSLGFDVGQLKLLEGEVQDAKHICDGLDYPPYLMGLVDAKFDNQDIAERSLYTNAIIPDAISDDMQMTSILGLDKFGLKLFTDFSHTPALQENAEKQSRAMLFKNQACLIAFMNNIITWNEWRIQTNMQPASGMDKYYFELLQDGQVFGAVPNIAHGTTNDSNSNSNDNQNSNNNDQ